ncbi:ribulose-phosphate 3-epimerase [Clostridium magnum]|uniref:Ribulose-phosphate 3-epimerase n=1 Tax=Clostridium magnum DSM 2767 TaxID=1121326 RepID=A0A161WSS9_9CLOT|nr:ribulose-phosphate 3-epimerase [Clostridium magnum]KZL89888.1 ribulose-phosphate 3-epimerase [Clostridium magnum DSM 2767]SHI46623.1 ribulose-5-phosphate 3-epimerase [Clostridium magnum DSM 2767]
MVKFAASIMCANQLNLKNELENLQHAQIDMLHCDIMDGIFVNNLAMGPYILEQIKENTDILLDLHLTTITPEKYITMFKHIKPEYISFHIETVEEPRRTIELIKSEGIKASVAISPLTPIEKIGNIIGEVDMINFMTVNPGFSGQKINYSAVNKLLNLKEICLKNNIYPLIEVDGCINKDTIPMLLERGANVFVLGTSSIFNNDNMSYYEKVMELRDLVK